MEAKKILGDRRYPPVVLVRTWVELIKSNEDEQVRIHATKMLIGAFGDIQTAAAFCKQNDIGIN